MLNLNNKIKAIIIDDEKQAREILNALIAEYCPDVEIIATAHSVKTGIECINSNKPNLVFLDIDMADGYGFEVLQKTNNRNYGVVFTTAYSSYAAKAFDYSALHYLLKPIDIEALIESVERFNRFKQNILPSQIETLTTSVDEKPKKINIQINNDIEVFKLDEILYFTTEGGTTILYLKNKQIRFLPQSLNHYEELLCDNGFFRAHAKYLVNLRSVVHFKSHGRLGLAKLSDEKEISISARKKTLFINALKEYNR